MAIDALMQSRINAGVSLLNAKKPGWYYEIDLDRLDMCDPKFCLLGQLYKQYTRGMRQLGFGFTNERAAIDHGFVLPAWLANTTALYQQLTSAWIDKIQELRSQVISV